MASVSLIEMVLRSTTVMERELRQLWSDLRIDNEIGDFYVMLLSTCTTTLKDYNDQLRHPAEPLQNEMVETIEYRNSQFVERVKAAVDNKAKLMWFGDTVHQNSLNAIEEKIVELLKG